MRGEKMVSAQKRYKCFKWRYRVVPFRFRQNVLWAFLSPSQLLPKKHHATETWGCVSNLKFMIGTGGRSFFLRIFFSAVRYFVAWWLIFVRNPYNRSISNPVTNGPKWLCLNIMDQPKNPLIPWSSKMVPTLYPICQYALINEVSWM